MKILLTFFFLTIIFSCGSSRSVQKSAGELKFIDKTEITRQAPADRVYITIPATPKDRPKASTQTHLGEEGARTDVTFNEDGLVTNILTDCPEVSEKELRDMELDYSFREKESQREFSAEIAKQIKSTIIWVVIIICVTRAIERIIFRF